jgi:16S rRNA processing protein RimM
MKSLQIKDFIVIGAVAKTHGTAGELRLDANQKLKQKEWVMIDFNQKPVPFFMEQCRELLPNEYLVKLRDYNTIEAVQDFVGRKIYYYTTKAIKSKKQIDESIIGYTLIDLEKGTIGQLEEMVKMPGQTLFQTTYKYTELLIPAVADFIDEINHEKQIIYLKLPEGLIT